ncbi:MAG: hypothetical protein IKC87_04240 [Clostridia bacterium]|nr:hypothetical protein [Clostridia bacterium]
MWNEIKNESDIIHFMNSVSYLHDSCVKEVKYISGAYVDSELSMHAVNDVNSLTVTLQRQSNNIHTFEMEFVGIKQLHLMPLDNLYTCEILESSLFIKDGLFYWCDDSEYDLTSIDNAKGIYVCSSGLRWRSI